MSNAARPRKSSMEGLQISDRHRAWQEAQDATAPETEVIVHKPRQEVEHWGVPTMWDRTIPQHADLVQEEIPLPVWIEGRPNVPILFVPDPEREDKAPDWRSPSIWDAVVDVNIKDSSGLKVYGGKVKLMGIDFDKYSGFVLTFPGGDEARYSITEGKVFGKVTTVLRQFQEALQPYADDPEFLYSIEGPLLVVLYWYRSRGLSVNEVRLLERG